MLAEVEEGFDHEGSPDRSDHHSAEMHLAEDMFSIPKSELPLTQANSSESPERALFAHPRPRHVRPQPIAYSQNKNESGPLWIDNPPKPVP